MSSRLCPASNIGAKSEKKNPTLCIISDMNYLAFFFPCHQSYLAEVSHMFVCSHLHRPYMLVLSLL